MALLARPDGMEIWWDEAGDGPTIVICNTFNLARTDELVELLAGRRRVITLEPRGVGRSGRGGPYDVDTGAADLEALLETTGPAAMAFGIGDGAHRAVRLADARPDLIEQVVFTSTTLGQLATAGFSASTEVLGALMSLLRRDYRTGLRSMVSGAQPDAGEERARVEELASKIPQEAAVGYLDAWIRTDSTDAARALGTRLTVMGYEGNAWFPLAMYEDMTLALPDARYETVDDGPMSRPDLAAEIVLRLSEPAKG
jgi:pimeloyl-ACP methyl ester carboxylesterase